MKQNNLILLALLVLSPVIIQASAPKPGSAFSISMGSAGGNAAPAVRTSHDLTLDLKALGEAFSKFQVGLSPEMADQFKKITDPKTLGELLEKFKIIPQNLTVGMDYKQLGEALASVKINIDEKAIRELMGSKEVQEAIRNLKLVDQVRITVPEIPRVPVDVSVQLSAENGRRIAATTGATMSTISIALQGAGVSNCCLLAGSCIAMDPTALTMLHKWFGMNKIAPALKIAA